MGVVGFICCIFHSGWDNSGTKNESRNCKILQRSDAGASSGECVSNRKKGGF